MKIYVIFLRLSSISEDVEREDFGGEILDNFLFFFARFLIGNFLCKHEARFPISFHSANTTRLENQAQYCNKGVSFSYQCDLTLHVVVFSVKGTQHKLTSRFPSVFRTPQLSSESDEKRYLCMQVVTDILDFALDKCLTV